MAPGLPRGKRRAPVGAHHNKRAGIRPRAWRGIRDANEENPVQVRDAIERNLQESLHPARLEIEDESHRHAGHAGARPEGETHFRLTVVAEAFAGKSRVERQRMVYAALKDLMATRIHALSLATLTPSEDR